MITGTPLTCRRVDNFEEREGFFVEERNLEKALELARALLRGEEVSAKGANVSLYEEYSSNSQVYDLLRLILKKFDLELYEYNNAL